MRIRTTRVAAALALALAARPAAAQEAGDWDVTLARGATREIDFTVDEGTWLSVDVSPDGRWIAFDLLGHIYRVPADGGAAEALTQESGVAVNFHPRYSPDGRYIAFISDRRGQNNLWVMRADGSDPRPVFTDRNVRASMPAWTPDGDYIIVRRDYVGEGGGGGSGLWMYHREGGQGVELVDDRAASWPSVSPDGRYVYYQVRSGRDALAGDYQIRRLELRTGEIIDITAGGTGSAASGRVSSGGAFAPEISPDGRWLAFGRQIPDGTVEYRGHRFGPRTALWLRELETGAERVVMDPIAVAIESGSKALRTLPGYDWAPDGRSIVLWQGGRIRRVDVASGEVATIPFTARVHRTISGMAYRPFRIEDGPFEARFLRWHTASPDGKKLAFQAVGRIWVTDLVETEDATVAVRAAPPRRLTPASFGPLEYAPAWSPDGKWIAFTTWDDTLGGHVWKVPADGGRPRRLTKEPGEYVHPAWSPDGREVLVVRGSGATARGRTLTHNPWWDLVRIPADGGEPKFVTRVALPAGTSPSSMARRSILQPSYGPEGRIFFREPRREGRDSEMALVSVAPDGSDRRVHLTFPDADEIVPSPDGRWVAFQEGDNVYLTAMPWLGTGAEPVDLRKRRGRLPVRTLSTEGGLFPRWRDAHTVEFGSGTRYFAYDVEAETMDTVEVRLEVPRRVPDGTIALTGARIVTLGPDSVIERGTIVVEGSRIRCVGACDTAGADRVIDASGKTIIPGWVDMHSHHYREHRGYRPRRDYEVAIYLAYGVTTSLDNSMWSQNIFPTAELIEAGEMIGPRTFSTGDPLYRGDAARNNDLSGYEAAEHNVERLKSWGAVSIKQYMQPRRDQRQWVSHAARAHGLMVTAEGGDLFYNLSMIMDGQTGWEHPLSYVPIYRDVATFFGQAGAVYSPTLVVAGPGPWNIEYFFGASDVWRDAKQRRWMPWRMLAGHLRRRTLRPETDYSYPLLAEGLKDIIAAGGWGAIGSHGEHHGIAAHWEVWMAASALGPYGALDVASRHGAHFLGVSQDLGTLEPGKLADLLVLDANPLEDIHNTLKLRWVMKGGALYDADTLDEVWPTPTPFGPYYWVDENALRDDVRPMDVWDRAGAARAGGAGGR
ncbi:MAG TPA: amidohydrolase family protein [Longimicrobiales bacterium]